MTKKDIQRQVDHLGAATDKKTLDYIDLTNEYELCDSRNFSGHICVSAIVVHLAYRKILVLSPKSGAKAELPSRHVYYEDKSLSVAARELIDEKISLSSDKLLPIKVEFGAHYCSDVRIESAPEDQQTGQEAHDHYDFRFVFAYCEDRYAGSYDKDYECKWLDLDDDLAKELIGDLALDELILSEIDKYEQADKKKDNSGYFTTPIAWYQFELANSYFWAEKIEAAENMYIRCVDSFEHTYNDQYETPPSILSALKNLAILYEETSRAELAVKIFEKALEFSRMYARWDDNFAHYVPKFESAIERIK